MVHPGLDRRRIKIVPLHCINSQDPVVSDSRTQGVVLDEAPVCSLGPPPSPS